jgi:hypothetical protein
MWFYLPAYRRRELKLVDTGLCFPNAVVQHLTYSDSLRSHLLRRFKLLNAVQQNAIVAFLESVRDRPRNDYRS